MYDRHSQNERINISRVRRPSRLIVLEIAVAKPTSLLGCLPSRAYLNRGSSLTSAPGATGFSAHDRDTPSSLFKPDTDFFRHKVRACARQVIIASPRIRREYSSSIECVSDAWRVTRGPINRPTKRLSTIFPIAMKACQFRKLFYQQLLHYCLICPIIGIRCIEDCS